MNTGFSTFLQYQNSGRARTSNYSDDKSIRCFCFLCRAWRQVFCFRFVTVFASLYYYAFVGDWKTDEKLLRLAVSLCSFMTIGQWWYMVRV